ncbi:DnaJ family domain-containing protein [Dissulfurirhabdus thermomarina]|uniref:DnaJ family domain-containing protein n=1 Tax=Dissulfurirhabdus thermomarina TaxID=1765737 RepID=UPI002852E251|nr:DnaJ family domain-containing protein [Dissulfurirhabdus thermomarina]
MSLRFLEMIAEQRIREAQERGELDDLPGAGRPLRFEDDTFVPPDLRLAYKMLKNAGYLPPELEEERELRSTAELLRHLEDEGERYRQVQKLNLLVTRINLRRRRPVNLEVDQVYYRKVVERVQVRR